VTSSKQVNRRGAGRRAARTGAGAGAESAPGAVAALRGVGIGTAVAAPAAVLGRERRRAAAARRPEAAAVRGGGGAGAARGGGRLLATDDGGTTSTCTFGTRRRDGVKSPPAGIEP
jgi:hypothetical protein